MHVHVAAPEWRRHTDRRHPNAARNGCAQAAIARVLAAWDRLPEGAEADPALAVYRRFPPDTPLALFGTTPRRVEEICRRCGLVSERWCGGGANARARLERSLADGVPVIVLLDGRHSDGGWGLHYAVATRCDRTGVTCTNMLPNPRAAEADQHFSWDRFMAAWGTWVPWPGLRHVGIAARP